MHFGKFPSLDAFLESYEAGRQARAALTDSALPRPARRDARRAHQHTQQVEVQATLVENLGDEITSARHHILLVSLDVIISSDAPIAADLQQNLDDGTQVLVAIRFGDRTGIMIPIEGMDPGASLDLSGAYIPQDQAYEHAGERRPVIHYTHHPLGFVCTEIACYN